MKLIVLAGLVSIEKITLSLQLALALSRDGLRVTLLDNIARLAISSEEAPVPLIRVRGAALPQLPALLRTIDSDAVIFAVSEEQAPEALAIALDDLQTQINTLQIQTFALIDLRTCDCFPHLRQQFEQSADVVLHMPFVLEEVLQHVGDPIS
jgi:hypothetical protein